MTTKGLFTVMIIVSAMPMFLLAETVRMSQAPLPYGKKIFTLYEEGKLMEARKALQDFVKTQINGSKGIELKNEIDVEGKLGVSVALIVVSRCFELEQKFSQEMGPPKELLQASHDARVAMEEAIQDVAGAAIDSDRVSILLKDCKQRSANLLVREIVALRNGGQSDLAKTMAEANASFLKERGISVEDILPKINLSSKSAGGASPLQKGAVGPGLVLPICQLLLNYYQALVAEDTDALNNCLVRGPKFLDGTEIIRRLDKERVAERDFDALGPVVFDKETVVDVVQTTENDLQVSCRGVVKSFILRGKAFQQRENDRFMVRNVDGVYKLIMTSEGN